MALETTLRLVAFALGAVGGALVFLEFFQHPSYIEFDTAIKSYNVDIAPDEVDEHTWLGRIGALAVSLAFALLFVAELL